MTISIKTFNIKYESKKTKKPKAKIERVKNGKLRRR